MISMKKYQSDYYKKILAEAKENNVKIDEYWSNWYNTGGYEYVLVAIQNCRSNFEYSLTVLGS